MIVLWQVINKDPDLEVAVQDSVAPPMALVGHQFQPMKIKDNPVNLGVTTTAQNIEEMFQHVLFVDPLISHADHTAKGLHSQRFTLFLKAIATALTMFT